MTGGRRQRADEFGAGGIERTFIAKDATGGLGEGIDVEDDGGGIRQDVEVTTDLAELEHAVGDGRRAGEGIIRRRADDPRTRALLTEGVRRGGAVGEDGRQQVVGGARAAEDKGLVAGHADLQGAADGERTVTAGVDEDVGAGRVEEDVLRQRGGGAEVGQRTRGGRGVTDLDHGRTVEGADVMEGEHALVDLRGPGVSGSGDARPEGDATGAARAEDMGGAGGEDIAREDRVAAALEDESAGGGALVGVPDGAVQRQQPVETVVDGEVTEIGGGAGGRADDSSDAGDAGGITAATGEVEIGVIAAGTLRDVGQVDRLVVQRASGSVIEDETSGDVIAEMVELAVEGARSVGADLELAVIEVHRLGRGVGAEGAAAADAHGAAVDADILAEAVLVVLEPERRVGKDVGLDQAVGGIIHAADLALEDPVAGAEEDGGVAGVEEEITGDQRIA